MHKTTRDSIKETSREEYLEEIKKQLQKISSLEAMKSIYEMTLICIKNEQSEIKDGNVDSYR